jgi:hypothetical protein
VLRNSLCHLRPLPVPETFLNAFSWLLAGVAITLIVVGLFEALSTRLGFSSKQRNARSDKLLFVLGFSSLVLALFFKLIYIKVTGTDFFGRLTHC